MSRLRLLVVIIALAAVTVAAQGQFWGRRGRFRVPPRYPTAESFDGRFNFCRLQYASGYREAGGQGWTTDYPDADINFSIRLSELTKTRVSRQPDGEPNHLVVRPTDDALFSCPFVLASDVGTMVLEDGEAEALRAYFLKGGFLWVDDFWGPWAWDNWANQIGKVLPPAQYPIVDLPPDHPIYRTLFPVAAVPQVPSIQFWRQTGGRYTSERGEESAEPHLRGISDRHGRLMVVMTHNTDISDAWEREGEDPRFFYSFSPQGYAVGMNVALYAMTH
ncbi:MAG: DUF4159 domain-containing protein [Vicinamibacterales bacterium]